MTIGLTIPGVETVHPREAWEPVGYRMLTDFDRTPSSLNIYDVTRGVAHYTSAINLPDGDPGEILTGVDGIRRLLANTQIDYFHNRNSGGYTRKSDGRWFPGFPVGYSFAVDWLGGVWEIRGWDIYPAATGQHNSYTLPILFLTDRADAASDLMLRSARMIWREARRRGARMRNDPWAHGWFRERTGTGTFTACCGDAVKGQILDGKLNLDYTERPVDGLKYEWTDPLMALHGARPELRLVDTRIGVGFSLPPAASTFEIPIPDDHDPVMAVLTVTADRPTGPGFLSLWGEQPSNTSKLNWRVDTGSIANTTLVEVGRTMAGRPVVRGVMMPNVAHLVVDLVAVISA